MCCPQRAYYFKLKLGNRNPRRLIVDDARKLLPQLSQRLRVEIRPGTRVIPETGESGETGQPDLVLITDRAMRETHRTAAELVTSPSAELLRAAQLADAGLSQRSNPGGQ